MQKTITLSILSLLLLSVFVGAVDADIDLRRPTPSIASVDPTVPSSNTQAVTSSGGSGKATKGCQTSWAYNGKAWVKRPVQIHYTTTYGGEFYYTIPGSRCQAGPNPTGKVSVDPSRAEVKPVLCDLGKWKECKY